MGFRILVRLFKYFSDERSASYVYVNDKHKSICDLEDYLRDLFGLNGLFCLTKDSYLLPNSENIAILRTDEVVSVIPLAESFPFFAEKSKCNIDVIENEIEKEAKKKKRKKNKEIIDETSGNDESLKSVSNKMSNKENISNSIHNNKALASPTTPELVNKKSKKIEGTAILDDSQKIEELNVTKYDEENTIENMKSKALGLLKDHFQTNINGVSDGRIKKRKRIRIRKGKKNNQVDLSSLSDGENNISQRSDSFVSVSGKINSHKRFPATSEKPPVAILRNQFDSKNFDNSPRIVRALSPKKSIPAPDAACDNSYDTLKDSNVVIKQNTEKAPSTDCFKSFEHRPLMNNNELPKENDIIAFKMLRMDENYSPIISKYIVGRVVHMCDDSRVLTMAIIEGSNECAEPSGKFDIEDDSLETTEHQNTIEIQWTQILEPRLCN